MKKFLLGTAIVSAAFAASVGSVSAATLDDVMARLDSLQRDNQAMRKEIATLRQNNAQATRQAVVPANAPSHSLPPTVSGAMAADLPASQAYYKGPASYAPYNWSGFYAGLNAGYAFGNETTSLNAPPIFAVGSAYINGFSGGGQIGYNLQMGNVVLGIEGDIQYANIASSMHVVFPGLFPAIAANKIEAFGTARGRIGYAFDRVLVYGTGGFAAGRTALTVANGGIVNDSAFHTGWAAGGGIEYGIRDGWSVRAEYLHVDLGSKDYLAGFFGGGVITSSNIEFDLVRAGVNYRF